MLLMNTTFFNKSKNIQHPFPSLLLFFSPLTFCVQIWFNGDENVFDICISWKDLKNIVLKWRGFDDKDFFQNCFNYPKHCLVYQDTPTIGNIVISIPITGSWEGEQRSNHDTFSNLCHVLVLKYQLHDEQAKVHIVPKKKPGRFLELGTT